jgi:hypothetical protein
MATFAAVEFVSPPGQPYVTVYCSDSSKPIKAVAGSPFACILAPDDLVRLAANPTKCARWVELASHTMIPPLRKLVPIITTKVRRKRVRTRHSVAVLNWVPRGRCTWRS